jgi:hypothetical protein
VSCPAGMLTHSGGFFSPSHRLSCTGAKKRQLFSSFFCKFWAVDKEVVQFFTRETLQMAITTVR